MLELIFEKGEVRRFEFTARSQKPFDPVVITSAQWTLTDKESGTVTAEGQGDVLRDNISILIPFETAGKTGTAQNPRGDDNSVFICFAPKDNPKIAIAAYVENAGFGATWALPVASLMLEKYLTGDISEARKPMETRIMETRFY